MKKMSLSIDEAKLVSGGECNCYLEGRVIAAKSLQLEDTYLDCVNFCCEERGADSYSTNFYDHYFCHSHYMKL